MPQPFPLPCCPDCGSDVINVAHGLTCIWCPWFESKPGARPAASFEHPVHARQLLMIIERFGISHSTAELSDPALPYSIHVSLEGHGESTACGATPIEAAQRARDWLVWRIAGAKPAASGAASPARTAEGTGASKRKNDGYIPFDDTTDTPAFVYKGTAGEGRK